MFFLNVFLLQILEFEFEPLIYFKSMGSITKKPFVFEFYLILALL